MLSSFCNYIFLSWYFQLWSFDLSGLCLPGEDEGRKPQSEVPFLPKHSADDFQKS